MVNRLKAAVIGRRAVRWPLQRISHTDSEGAAADGDRGK